MTANTPLHDIIVTELGERVGAGVCGSILAQLGATVIVPEGGTGDKAEHRARLMAGKLSVRLDSQAASDVELLDRLVARSPQDDRALPCGAGRSRHPFGSSHTGR